jgi:hypothetical protein
MPLDFDLGIAFGQRNPLLWVSPDFAPQPVTAAANTIYARSFHHEGRARGEFDETVASLAKNPVVERRMTFEPNHKEIEVASREKKSAMASAGRPNTIWLAPPVHASALAIDWLLSRAVCIRRFHCRCREEKNFAEQRRSTYPCLLLESRTERCCPLPTWNLEGQSSAGPRRCTAETRGGLFGLF